MREFDKEIDTLNRRRPDDRGVRPLAYATPEFARELKIPNMEKPGQFLWPPPAAELGAADTRHDAAGPVHRERSGGGGLLEERHRRMLEDNRRQIAEAEQRQREFEERQRKELESAKERDRQAYAERGWPSG